MRDGVLREEAAEVDDLEVLEEIDMLKFSPKIKK
jgi:hypothetical protein